MEMKASCQFDLESAKALIYSQVFKKKNPKRMVVMMTIATAILMTYVTFGCLTADSISPLALLLPAFIVCVYLRLCYIYFVWPKKMCKRNERARRHYVFRDDGFCATDPEDESYLKEVPYQTLVGGWETAQYLFLSVEKTSVFVVDKSTVNGGSIHELRAKLTETLGDAYIIYE